MCAIPKFTARSSNPLPRDAPSRDSAGESAHVARRKNLLGVGGRSCFSARATVRFREWGDLVVWSYMKQGDRNAVPDIRGKTRLAWGVAGVVKFAMVSINASF